MLEPLEQEARIFLKDHDVPATIRSVKNIMMLFKRDINKDDILITKMEISKNSILLCCGWWATVSSGRKKKTKLRKPYPKTEGIECPDRDKILKMLKRAGFPYKNKQHEKRVEKLQKFINENPNYDVKIHISKFRGYCFRRKNKSIRSVLLGSEYNTQKQIWAYVERRILV